MLTSFFGKSRPLNFLVVSLYIFVIGAMVFYGVTDTALDMGSITGFIASILGIIFTVFVLDFIIRKNVLTQNNSIAVLVFSCSVMMIPALIQEPKIILANIFLILALRRIFSLQSPKNIEIKILDASLWIGLATIFYFWSFLLVISLYGAIHLRGNKQYRYFFIPGVVGVAIFSIATAYQVLANNSFSWWVTWLGDASLDFSSYAPTEILVFITFFFVMIVWASLSKIISLSKGAKKDRPKQVLLLLVVLNTMAISLFSSQKSGAEFLFFLAPSAMVISAYLEKKREIWFREILLWAFVLLPVVQFIF